MNHDPERDAAAYLSGEMVVQQADTFERHLLECEGCWGEVTEGREGRALAESARDLAPAHLREYLRAAISAHRPSTAPPRSPLLSRWLAVAAAVVLLVAGGSVYLAVRPPHQPASIAMAISDFRTGRLPGSGTPARPAPDLAPAGLQLTSSGTGRVGDLSVDAYAYRDVTGHRVFLYVSDRPFPVAAGAVRRAGDASPWTAHANDVELLCAQHPHALLLLSSEQDALQRAAAALGVR